MKKFCLATSNSGKVREIEQILGISVEIFPPNVEETGDTFVENALIKARAVCKRTNFPTLAEDSGLCVNALPNELGVHSARYSGGDDKENNEKLLREMKGKEDRAAYYEAAAVLVFPNGKEIVASGKTYGEILNSFDSGKNGFGYDSLFFSTEINKSFASATLDEKNSVSHRARALKKLLEEIKRERIFW
jgi:XTP/dITP diphosphohydrolase